MDYLALVLVTEVRLTLSGSLNESAAHAEDDFLTDLPSVETRWVRWKLRFSKPRAIVIHLLSGRFGLWNNARRAT